MSRMLRSPFCFSWPPDHSCQRTQTSAVLLSFFNYSATHVHLVHVTFNILDQKNQETGKSPRNRARKQNLVRVSWLYVLVNDDSYWDVFGGREKTDGKHTKNRVDRNFGVFEEGSCSIWTMGLGLDWWSVRGTTATISPPPKNHKAKTNKHERAHEKL